MPTPNYSALLDYATDAVLAISPHVAAIVFLNECMLDTRHAAAVHHPNYMQSFFLASLDPEAYPKWRWNRQSRKFVETQPDVVTEDLIARSRLAVTKVRVISQIIFHINAARHDVRTGIDFQETVYLTKAIQARRLKAADYSEELIMECPYVVQYADFADISLEQAVEDILLKAKIDDQLLARSELLRLVYFNKVKSATALHQMNGIFDEFMRECYRLYNRAEPGSLSHGFPATEPRTPAAVAGAIQPDPARRGATLDVVAAQ
jgi:hypothetical protein